MNNARDLGNFINTFLIDLKSAISGLTVLYIISGIHSIKINDINEVAAINNKFHWLNFKSCVSVSESKNTFISCGDAIAFFNCIAEKSIFPMK